MGTYQDEMELFLRESTELLESMGYTVEEILADGFNGNCRCEDKAKYRYYCEEYLKISNRFHQAITDKQDEE